MKWVSLQPQKISAPNTSTLVGNTDDQSLLDEVLKLISSANEIVIICSFLIASSEVGSAVRKAAERGVRVYVLTSAESALNDGKWFLTDTDRALEAKHRGALNELSHFARVRSSPHWHTKFILVDPHTKPGGLLLSANLNSHALRSSPEIAVRLREEEVKALFRIARYTYWSASSEIRRGVWSTSTQNRSLSQLSESPDVISTVRNSSAVLSFMRDQLSESKRVVLTSYSIDSSSVVMEELRTFAKKGGLVTVICHPSKNNASSLRELSEMQCKVLGIEWLHAKFLDSGGDNVLMVSQNLDAPTNRPRLETGLVLRKERAADARTWLDYWTKTAEWVLQ